MKKIILFSLFSLFIVSNLSAGNSFTDFLERNKLFQSYGSQNDGGNPGLTATGAFVGGGTANLALKKAGLKNNALFSLVRIFVAMFGPGLLAADYLDDQRINGSIFSDCAGLVKADKASMARLWEVLLTKAGVANVAFSGLGVFASEYLPS